MPWIDVAAGADVVEGEVLGCTAGGAAVALFRLEGAVFALHDQCSHGRAKLSEGFVEGDCVECPLHQGLVEIRTGEGASPPIDAPVRTYPAREVDGRVEVEV